MVDTIETHVSGYDEESITIRGRDLSSEVMDELNLGSATYLMLTGEVPAEPERRLFRTMLTSLLAHGMTSHVVATRLTFASEPKSVQGAVASGLLGVGSQSAGMVRECSAKLQCLVSAQTTNEAITELVEDCEVVEPFGVSEFAGVGHAYFADTDPRAEQILRIAEEEDLEGPHIEVLQTLRAELEGVTGEHLPVNVVGAIAAASSDMGLSPIAAQGISILSRTAGLVAEVEAEDTAPVAGDIRRLLNDHVEYSELE